jgi:hypothetical protein
MSEHTPTPWAAVRCERADGRYMRSIIGSLAIEPNIDPDGTFHDTGATVCTIYHEANAEHIVRCVNAHEELIAALEQAYDLLGDGSNLVWCHIDARIRSALACARGETP